MADDSVDSLPGSDVCPGSPRPRQACVFVNDNNRDAGQANDEEPPILPPIASGGSFFGRWTQDAPPGFEHLRSHPPASTSGQIPLAGTVFATEGYPPPGATYGSESAYPTEIFHRRTPSPGAIFGHPPPPNAAVFGNNPRSSAIFGNRPPSPDADAGFGIHTPYNIGYFPNPMHKCFALASTRVYDKNLRCDRCGGRSDLGWYYRCCHETDARLFESIRNGNEEHFDEIGKMLTQNIQPPARGPAARQDKLSPLNELPADQVESLSAPQLAKVLRQHEAAVSTALTDRHGPHIPPADEMPFLMPQAEECKTTLCPRCGRLGAGEQQSFLSLDGVLKGDIPPSAAVGFGFRALGGRPVANANIVKNLGLRDITTGLLPGQKSKGSAAESTMVGDESDDAGNAELADATAALKVEDAETRDDTTDPQISDGSLKADDSDVDLVQLYMDAQEETLADHDQGDEDVGHSVDNED